MLIFFSFIFLIHFSFLFALAARKLVFFSSLHVSVVCSCLTAPTSSPWFYCCLMGLSRHTDLWRLYKCPRTKTAWIMCFFILGFYSQKGEFLMYLFFAVHSSALRLRVNPRSNCHFCPESRTNNADLTLGSNQPQNKWFSDLEQWSQMSFHRRRIILWTNFFFSPLVLWHIQAGKCSITTCGLRIPRPHWTGFIMLRYLRRTQFHSCDSGWRTLPWSPSAYSYMCSIDVGL